MQLNANNFILKKIRIKKKLVRQWENCQNKQQKYIKKTEVVYNYQSRKICRVSNKKICILKEINKKNYMRIEV